MGISVDLNGHGAGLATYERLPNDSPIRLTIHGPGENVTAEARVVYTHSLGRNGGGIAGYRYGLAFEKPTLAQTDAVQSLCLHYAVPWLYDYYGQSQWMRHRRYDLHLPLFIGGEGGETVPAVTHEVSRESLSTLLPVEKPVGSLVPFELVTPLGRLRGTAQVVQSYLRHYAGRMFYRCALGNMRLQDEGHDILKRILAARAGGKHLQPIFNPSPHPRPIPMNKPLLAGLCIAAALLLVEFGVFRWVNRDEFFLADIVQMAKAGEVIASDDMARLDELNRATLQQSYPRTERLVLLAKAFMYLDRLEELTAVTLLLAPRDLNNLNLQVGLAAALDRHGDHERATVEYQLLLDAINAGRLPEARRKEILAGLARSQAHAGQFEHARAGFQELIRRYPDDMGYRNELAALLLHHRHFPEAVAAFQGVSPNYAGRVLLVLIHATAGESAAAEIEARTLLKLHPGDATGEGLLADMLQQRGEHRLAQAIYERLFKADPNNMRIALQLAHGSLWSKNYAEALERFQAIFNRLCNDPDFLTRFPDLPRGWVNAAASAARIGPAQKQTARLIADHVLLSDEKDASYLARLAWVLLSGVKDVARANAILDRAVELRPVDAKVRKEVAGTLVAVGRFKDLKEAHAFLDEQAKARPEEKGAKKK